MGGSRRRKAAARRPAGRSRDQNRTPVGAARVPKAERMAAERRARRRRAIRKRVVVGLLAAAAVALFVAKNVNDRRQNQRLVAKLTADSCKADGRSDGGSTHVSSPTYRIDPPAGGDHSSTAASAGVYDETDDPVEGELVHAMEHGYVILWHRPDLPESEQGVIEEVASRFDRDVVVVPRPSLEMPVAATAWHQRLLCGDVEREALAGFVQGYRNKGPEKVPH